MSKLDILQEKLEKILVPFSSKLGESKILQALSQGMMMTLPLTLGASFFLILGSFPIPAVSEFLTKIGVSPQLNAISGGTMSILGLYVSFTVAYSYAKLSEGNAVTAGLYALSSFFILMPQTIGEGDNAVTGFLSTYLGSSGLFVALLIAISVSALYLKLSKNNKLKIKLPESVPPMVAQSIEPLFIGLIIYLIIASCRMVFALTSFENIFNFINQIVAAPMMSIGGSVPSIIFIFTVMNVLFFFGIHPSPLIALMDPIVKGMMLVSIGQIADHQPVQYLNNLVVFDFINNFGTGSTLSLLLCALIFGKSARYKSLSKIAIGPQFFCINEPVIFGFPVMFNAILFIPFVLSSLISGFIGLFALKLGLLTGYNPTVAMSLPWTLPTVFHSLFIYGWQGFLMRIVTTVVLMFVYLPFFKILDRKEEVAEASI